MEQREKKINKKNYKNTNKKCKICGIENTEILEVHRIIEGRNQGQYKYNNVIACCPNCHTKIHKNQIQIDKWYFSSCGYLLRWIDEKGQEHFSQ
jgi:5-methylcytosine-specific restriction endonuclease McrA